MNTGILKQNPDMMRALQMARASFEHTSDGIVWITHDAKIIEANPAYCRFFGYSRDELLSMRIPDIDPNFNAATWQADWETLRQTKTITFETKNISKDGVLIDIEVVAHLMEFDGQEFNCAFLRDITERKQAERQLRLLETCVAHLKDIVVITEAEPIIGDGPRIVFVNKAFEQLTGYSAAEVGAGIPPAFRERIFQKFSQADASDSKARGGTGLGLAIAKEMVQKMGGSIDYESTMGRGSVFFTDWPIVDAEIS